MPTVTLKYNLPDEQEEYETCMRSSKNAQLVWELEQQIWRPARKHGYPDPHISKLLGCLDTLVEKYAQLDPEWPTDEYGHKNATDLIGLLERAYYELKNEE